MKKNDFTLIAVVVIVSAVFSLIVARVFISSPNNRQEKVEVVGPITTDFPEPDKRFFNDRSVNPTLIIEITPNDNQNPFRQSPQ